MQKLKKCLFTPCKLKFTRAPFPLPFPSTIPFAIPFTIFLNYSFCHFPLPYPFTIYFCHIPLPFPLPFLFTIIFFYNDFHLECEEPWFMGFLKMKIDISLIFLETIICRKKFVEQKMCISMRFTTFVCNIFKMLHIS